MARVLHTNMARGSYTLTCKASYTNMARVLRLNMAKALHFIIASVLHIYTSYTLIRVVRVLQASQLRAWHCFANLIVMFKLARLRCFCTRFVVQEDLIVGTEM